MTNEILKFSILSYIPINEIDYVDVIIPTIQNINISKNNNIVTRPTVTGKTLVQYSKSKPTIVNINILIQTNESTYTYLNEEISTNLLLQHIETISRDKLVFDLITTDANLKPYLNGLVIQSKTFTKSAERKNSIICTLGCTEVEFADISWELVDKSKVLGVDIGEDVEVRKINISMKRENDAALKFDFHKYLSTFNNTPGELTGAFLYNNSLPESPTFYLALDGITIDLKNGPSEYTINTNFKLNSATNSETDNAVDYWANFGNIIVDIHAESESINLNRQGRFSWEGSSINNTLSLLASMKLEQTYNVLNQYSELGINDSFDNFADRKKIATIISHRVEDPNFIRYLDDININGVPANKKIILIEHIAETLTTGMIDGVGKHLLAKDISDLYSYTISMGDVKSGGVKTIYGKAGAFVAQYRPFTQFYATQGQLYWYPNDSDKFGLYTSYLVSVNVGTKLYIFIISPSILRTDTIPGVES